MPRSRKQSEMSVPEVVITRDQYLKDIKIRWQIHQYEVNKLVEDLKKVAQIVAPYVQRIMDYSATQYQEIRSRYVAVR